MEKWEKIYAVQRMQDYIEEHIRETISLIELANAAGYSPWHSSRIFKELMGKTPFEYIRTMRLSYAALRLRDEEAKIIDVALDFVFNTHEGFTRAFSKEFGMAPSYYSKHTPPLKLFLPTAIRDYYLTIQKGEDYMSQESKSNTVFVQVIDRPARKLILKRGVIATHYFEFCEEVGCDIWGILCSIKDAIYEPIGMWMPKNLRPEGTSLYTQGVEVPEDYSGEVPEGFEIMDLSPCKMMVFQGEPYDDEKFEDAISALSDVIKNYDPTIYGFEWAKDDGPRIQLAPMGYRGYIEARPVQQVNIK